MVVSAPLPTRATAAKPQKQPRRTWWKMAAAFLICQVLAIGCVEAILYCAGMGEEEIFQFDNEIGFVHMHNKRLTWRTEGFAQSYLNGDGMREPNLTIAKPANTIRIALLGDSMVEGLQVPIEQTFGQLIEKRLSPFDGKQLQFLNFGMSGYSTAQEYLLLKRQVFKYNPDLVIVCYDSRDLFENWSPPDQVVTNVRPYALHLPGGKLVVDSSPVVRWMHSPRARFLISTTWLREHSRIVGLLSALDLEWSQHNPWYRAMIDAFAHPKKARNEFRQALATMWAGGPSFRISFFEDSKIKSPSGNQVAAPAPAAAVKPAAAGVLNSATGNESLSANPVAGAAVHEAKNTQQRGTGQQTYEALIGRTIKSLFSEMNKECTAHGAKMAVIGLPVRSQLCPMVGMDTSFAGIDYTRELEIVKQACTEDSLPFFSVENLAERLSYPEREKLFYTAHLTPVGQKFIADSLQPFVQTQLSQLLASHSSEAE